MTVDIWFGQWPTDDATQSMVGDLYRVLQPQPKHYTALFTFIPEGGLEIDLVVLKQDFIYIVEHKFCEWKIVGSTEGPWKAFEPKPDGQIEEHIMNPVNSSPFRQMRTSYENFVNWSSRRHEEISKDVTRQSFVNWRKARSYVVISPKLHPDSQIEMSKPTKCLGRDYFLNYELLQSSIKGEIELTETEMGRIPKMLNLNLWRPPEFDGAGLLDRTSILTGAWKPDPFAELVAYGHHSSVSVFHLSDIAKKVITVGRAPDNDLVIKDTTISAHHAEFQVDTLPNGQKFYMVKDNGSRNGTYIAFSGKPEDERKIDPNNRFGLKNGSLVRFGSIAYTFLEQKEQPKP